MIGRRRSRRVCLNVMITETRLEVHDGQGRGEFRGDLNSSSYVHICIKEFTLQGWGFVHGKQNNLGVRVLGYC